jgi:hypothetical protein
VTRNGKYGRNVKKIWKIWKKIVKRYGKCEEMQVEM